MLSNFCNCLGGYWIFITSQQTNSSFQFNIFSMLRKIYWKYRFPSTKVILNALLDTACYGLENIWKMLFQDDYWIWLKNVLSGTNFCGGRCCSDNISKYLLGIGFVTRMISQTAVTKFLGARGRSHVLCLKRSVKWKISLCATYLFCVCLFNME